MDDPKVYSHVYVSDNNVSDTFKKLKKSIAIIAYY